MGVNDITEREFVCKMRGERQEVLLRNTNILEADRGRASKEDKWELDNQKRIVSQKTKEAGDSRIRAV